MHELKIGILAKRGHDRCLKKWSNTAYYLDIWVPGYTFSILPLDFHEIEDAIRKKKIDFLLANPAIYAEMEDKYGLSRIATLKNRRLSRVTTLFGGVIFSRADRKDIKEIKDLKGKDFMAVSRTSFGGWYAAWRYLLARHFDPLHDFSKLYFGQTHDKVVFSVRDGVVDAGCVRTDTLERMAAEGKISLSDFKILGLKAPGENGFPFARTTRLYPEWPFAKLAHVPSRIAEKVAVALLKMEPDAAAAKDAKCAGWTIPLSYEPIHECLKALKVGPYKNLGKVSLSKIIREYKLAISIFAVAFVLLSFSAFYLKRLSDLRKDTIEKLRKSERERKRIYAQLLHSQKMEAVGQLAAGLAHEINTPVQYVSTNIDFLEESCSEMQELMDGFERLFEAAKSRKIDEKIVSEIEELLQDADWDYLKPEILEALSQSREGIKRIASIINAMKAFSRPGTGGLQFCHLHEIISATLEVSKHEWKDIAMVERHFDENLDTIPCYSNELGQAFLNLIVNAAHAISERILEGQKDYQGVIRIITRREGNYAVVEFHDNGVGMSENIIDKIFDPFFTTKSVGKGTGQGLTICFDVITRKHRGKISVKSKPGAGTAFFIYLPLEASGTDEMETDHSKPHKEVSTF